MKIAAVAFALLSLSLGQETPCADSCIEIYSPVCGSDGVTYTNECFLGVESCKTKTEISVSYEGECKKAPCVDACPMNYQPVCGSDGRTYSNACVLSSESCKTDSLITVLYDGECREECERMCAMDYNPVCGTDGVTYSNLCQFEVSACRTKNTIQIYHTGECKANNEPTVIPDPCPGLCTMEYNPVCGSDKKTYSNLCILESEICRTKKAISVAYQGECVEEKPCPDFCPMNYQPVCGSNWVTYGNECLLFQAACKTKTEIISSHPFACEEVPCNMKCSSAEDFVCGTDGVTYTNTCMMLLASCEKRKSINVAHQGKCTSNDKKPCNDICTKIYLPVCGSDSITYGNECLLESASCHSEEKGLDKIMKLSEGHCPSDQAEVDSVGSNGNAVGISIGAGIFSLLIVAIAVVVYKKGRSSSNPEASSLLQNQTSA